MYCSILVIFRNSISKYLQRALIRAHFPEFQVLLFYRRCMSDLSGFVVAGNFTASWQRPMRLKVYPSYDHSPLPEQRRFCRRLLVQAGPFVNVHELYGRM
jgi:hypothetical protein